MFFPRSTSLLFALSSFSIILLVILFIQFFENRVPDRTAKAYSPPTLRSPVTNQEEATLRYGKDRPDSIPQWNYLSRYPKEVPFESKTNPKTDPLFWEEVLEDLALIIEEKYPELKLSRGDLQNLTETIRTLQKSMLELGELERSISNREEIQKIRGELNRALETVEEITKMGISDFILFGRPESGIDNEKPDDEEIIKETLGNFKS